ncbi:MAG TPA: nucleotide sugar dehydrogenase [Candidatus Omnitrophota bacterium]|nr:nucleotide sugar dehydrogenase [Candidatus Omnitrophota bacterium]
MNSYVENFKKKIQKRSLRIAVVGLGYVGLPLAIEYAKKGFSVCGIDVDHDRVENIKKKISYITDVPTSDLRKVVARGTFRGTNEFAVLAHSDVVIICVPTPLKTKFSPNISYILSAVSQIKKYLHRGQLIVLESTTYPGTTEEAIMPVLQSSGLTCGKDFFLAFSPERIDPGNAKFPVHKIPKVVGGITPEATTMTCLLYSNIVARAIPVSSARVAETVKLLENTFRIVNIGLIDEIAMMCHKMNIDIWEVIDAAKTKPFGFMPFYPGPGVGGHCIPKDPLYLFWKAKKFGFHSRFIKLSSDVISYMPEYVISRVKDVLHAKGKRIEKAHILVLGATYKKDIKDLRKSPAIDIIAGLREKGISMSYHDPLIPYLKIDHINLHSVPLTKEEAAKADCVIIATDHSCVDYDFVRKNARLIFDTRNIYKGINDKKIIRL